LIAFAFFIYFKAALEWPDLVTYSVESPGETVLCIFGIRKLGITFDFRHLFILSFIVEEEKLFYFKFFFIFVLK